MYRFCKTRILFMAVFFCAILPCYPTNTKSNTVKLAEKNSAEQAIVQYWDDFDFRNCNIENTQGSTLALKYYVDIVSLLAEEKRQTALLDFLQKTEKYPEANKFFIQLLCDAYSLPNSIYKNEDIYISLLNYCLISSNYEQREKEMYSKMLKTAVQNRPGTPANNFYFTDLDKTSCTLYDIDAEYLVLYFYNPGCNACHETSKILDQSQLLTDIINSGKVKLLAISLEPDVEKWRTESKNKSIWLHGQDADDSIQLQGIYDLRAIPTIYLLDKNKHVILKDCSTDTIISFLTEKTKN